MWGDFFLRVHIYIYIYITHIYIYIFERDRKLKTMKRGGPLRQITIIKNIDIGFKK